MAITIGTTGRYERGTEKQSTFAQIMTDPKNGLWARRQLLPAPNASIVWRIPFSHCRASELDAIVTEFLNAKGSAGEVTFRPPESTLDITVRFVEGSLRYVRKTARDYAVTFSLIQEVAL
jgi:hypothetical protein